MINDDLAKASMAIILPAGAARSLIRKALECSSNNDHASARQLLAQAKTKVLEGHKAQTKYVQGEARGETQEYTILFTHAQDHLMTVMSEHNLALQLVEAFAKLDERLSALEAR